MITKHIIKNLQEELDNRDATIKRLKIKNHELQSVFSDWIEKGLATLAKKFPDEYIKQKKEFAEAIVSLNDQRAETSEILNLQEEKHKKEVGRLKFEIEMLEERLPKTPSFLDIFAKSWRKR